MMPIIESLSGRKGPVLISIPYTFFEKEIPTGLSSQKREPEENCIAAAENEQKKLDLFLNQFEELMRGKTETPHHRRKSIDEKRNRPHP